MKFQKLIGILLFTVASQGCAKNDRGIDPSLVATPPKSAPPAQPAPTPPAAPPSPHSQHTDSASWIMKIVNQSTCGVELAAQGFPENEGSRYLRVYQFNLKLSARGDYHLSVQEKLLVQSPDTYELIDHDLKDIWYIDGDEVVLNQAGAMLARIKPSSLPSAQKASIEFERDYMVLPSMILDVLACLQNDVGALAPINQQQE